MTENDEKYEKFLANAPREKLVEKIRNQRTEIKNLARSYGQMVHHAGEYHQKIKAAAKRLQNGQHLTALWHLTGKCDDSEAVLRELAEGENPVNVSINIDRGEQSK